VRFVWLAWYVYSYLSIVISCDSLDANKYNTILGYELHTWGTIQIVAGAKDFSLLQNILTGSRAHSTSFFMGIRGSFPGG
jgi:hypothetical protein